MDKLLGTGVGNNVKGEETASKYVASPQQSVWEEIYIPREGDIEARWILSTKGGVNRPLS